MKTSNSRKRQVIACVVIGAMLGGAAWAQDRSRIQDPPLPPTTPSDPTSTPGIVSPARPLTGTDAPDDRIPGSADRSVANPIKPIDTTPRAAKSADDSPAVTGSKKEASTKEIAKNKKRSSGAKSNSTKPAVTKKNPAVS